jgi:histidine phosphotransferase ChpT
MDFAVDLRVLELLASRLCHDLVGPVGAINNGLEMIADEESGMAEEALELADTSARRAANTLQFYRLAYGTAGDRVGSDYRDLRELSIGLLSHTKIELQWEEIAAPDGAPDGLGKLILNMVVLAEESLPRGGTITVGFATDGAVQVSVVASGPGGSMREETKDAMEDSVRVRDLTPRNVQGYFTCLLAKRFGGRLLVSAPTNESVGLTVTLPA